MKQHFAALALTAAVVLAAAPAALAQGRYTMTQNGDVIELRDTQANIKVSVLTGGLHSAYEMVVNGHDVIRKNFTSVDEVRKSPGLRGIPLLAPYANRLDEQAFYANGQKYNFDMELGNVRGNVPIHGYVSNTREWVLVEAKADETGAWVTSRLDFYKNPRFMKQFPFAHTITVTYKLADGMLETRTRVENMSSEPMPLAIGYHPYFNLTDSPPQDWTMSIGAKTHWLLDERTIPTGQTQPITALIPTPANFKVVEHRLDDIFTDLERDAQGRGKVTLKGRTQQLDVLVGPKYPTMLVLATPPAAGRGRGAGPGATPNAPPPPPPQGWNLAIEPMAGITNSMNLAHRGLYKDLQSIEPGGVWEESFWLRPTGY